MAHARSKSVICDTGEGRRGEGGTRAAAFGYGILVGGGRRFSLRLVMLKGRLRVDVDAWGVGGRDLFRRETEIGGLLRKSWRSVW
jgi:hypothetical protein